MRNCPRPSANQNPRRAAKIRNLLLVVALAFAFSLNGWSQTAETPYAIAEVQVNAPIPDGDTQTGLSSSIFIPGDETLEAIEVAVQIDHPAVEQLLITLVHPDGTSVVMHNQTASSEAPFSPIYDSKTTPTQPLAPLLNKSPLGEWTLRVIDAMPNHNGTLIGWGLKLRPPSVLTLPPPTPAPLPAESFLESSSFLATDTITNAQSIDVNNDGLHDLFLHFANADRIDLYLSGGAGGESFLPFALNFAVDNPQRVVAGDVNGDGKTDFIAASQANAAAVVNLTVYLANDAGGFSPGFTAGVSITTNLNALALVDANGDGALDLIVGGIPKLFSGIGDGSFKLEGDLVDLGRRFLGYADLDGDGADELLVTRSRGGTSSNIDPYILKASSNLSFNDRVKLIIEDANFQYTFAASPEVPGRTEFTSISTTGEVEPTWFFSRVFASSGEFSVIEKRLPADSFSSPLQAFDLNGDGLTEFIYPGDNGVMVFQRTEDILGGQTQRVFTRSDVLFALPGVYFSDGRAGLVVIDQENRVILATSSLGPLPTPTPDAPPQPTATPFLFPPEATVTPTPQPTPTVGPTPNPSQPSPDLNGDGIVNAADLLILIQHWNKRVDR